MSADDDDDFDVEAAFAAELAALGSEPLGAGSEDIYAGSGLGALSEGQLTSLTSDTTDPGKQYPGAPTSSLNPPGSPCDLSPASSDDVVSLVASELPMYPCGPVDEDGDEEEPESFRLLRQAMERRERALDDFDRDLQQAHRQITAGVGIGSEGPPGRAAPAGSGVEPKVLAQTPGSAGGEGVDAGSSGAGDGDVGERQEASVMPDVGQSSFLPSSSAARSALVKTLFKDAAAAVTAADEAVAAAKPTEPAVHTSQADMRLKSVLAVSPDAQQRQQGLQETPGTGGAEPAGMEAAAVSAAQERRRVQVGPRRGAHAGCNLQHLATHSVVMEAAFAVTIRSFTASLQYCVPCFHRRRSTGCRRRHARLVVEARGRVLIMRA